MLDVSEVAYEKSSGYLIVKGCTAVLGTSSGKEKEASRTLWRLKAVGIWETVSKGTSETRLGSP